MPQTPIDWSKLTDGLPAGIDPLRVPLDRYGQLPKYTRELMEELREEDVLLIADVLSSIRAVRASYRLLKRLAEWAIGTFLAAYAFGEDALKAWGRFKGWMP